MKQHNVVETFIWRKTTKACMMIYRCIDIAVLTSEQWSAWEKPEAEMDRGVTGHVFYFIFSLKLEREILFWTLKLTFPDIYHHEDFNNEWLLFSWSWSMVFKMTGKHGHHRGYADLHWNVLNHQLLYLRQRSF